MSVWGVSGAAGFGKTYRLIKKLEEELASSPLKPGQSVLALTFMHGARQRLEQRLRSVAGLNGRYNCITVDSFARSTRHRWRMLATHLGQPPVHDLDFTKQCALTAELVERDVVGRWLGSGYPMVILDEAQDLDQERLRLVAAMSEHAHVLVAFDDFQCLKQEQRPSPVVDWLLTVCEPEVLQKPQRTNVQELLNAASAIRDGAPPVSGKHFKVIGFKAPGMATAYLACQFAFNVHRQSIAIITPARSGGYAEKLVSDISSKPCGTRRLGPYPTKWEGHDSSALSDLESQPIPEESTIEGAINGVSNMQDSTLKVALLSWLRKQEQVVGRTTITKTEIQARAELVITHHRAHVHRSDLGRRALTVHQAKNREFDGVFVIWPYTVGSDDEGKRRLLYNAVTRAKKWCYVFVQGEDALRKPPFA